MLPIANIKGFLKKYITFSSVDWLRNGESLRNGPIYKEDPVLWSGKKGIFVFFVLIFAGVYRRYLIGFGQRPKFFNPSA